MLVLTGVALTSSGRPVLAPEELELKILVRSSAPPHSAPARPPPRFHPSSSQRSACTTAPMPPLPPVAPAALLVAAIQGVRTARRPLPIRA